MLCCHITPQALLMLGSTRSLTLCAWESSQFPLLNRSSSVCAALTGCWGRSLGCPRPVEGWRGVGQKHPHISAGALSSHAVAQGSALMEHEVIQNRLGSTGSDLNSAQVFLPPEAGLRELQHPYGNLHLMLACLPPVCTPHMWSVRKSRINSKESCY